MTFFDLVKKFYAPVAAAFTPKPPAPAAVQMLNDFDATVAKINAFATAPNDGAKYLYLRDNGPFPTDEYMGVPAGWKNAVDGEGELNGRTVRSFTGDPNTATFTWALGSPPGYYVAPQAIDGKAVLKKYLTDMANASPYLRSLGLTPEAVAAK